jgi:hypothetical protein
MWWILSAFLIGMAAGRIVGGIGDRRYVENGGICPVCKCRTRVRKPEDA